LRGELVRIFGEVAFPEVVTTGVRQRGWRVVQNYGGVLLQSAGMTVILSVISFPLAIALGLLQSLSALGNLMVGPFVAMVDKVRDKIAEHQKKS